MSATEAFPVELLVPLSARYWSHHGPRSLAAIHIALELEDLRGHENRSCRFPVNPQDGCIDGSLYLQGVHVPVDVTALDFGAMQARGLSLRLTGSMTLLTRQHPGWEDRRALHDAVSSHLSQTVSPQA